jgi:hypothetical protein
LKARLIIFITLITVFGATGNLWAVTDVDTSKSEDNLPLLMKGKTALLFRVGGDKI